MTDNKLWNWAGEVPAMLMNDANWQNHLLLQAISRCPAPFDIDIEIGSAAGDLIGDNPLLTYVRYKAELQIQALSELGIKVSSDKLKSIREMSDAGNRQQLYEIGQAVASNDVDASHFPIDFAN